MKMSPLWSTIASFIASNRGNRWFEDEQIKIYLRRTRHYIGDKAVECIDIANVEVREDYQGQGIFTEYLSAIERLAKVHKLVVYVENVHNQRLGGFLLKRGYNRLSGIRDFCAYKVFASSNKKAQL